LEPRLAVLKARCLYETNNFIGALELLISFEKIGCDTPDILLLKGMCLDRLHEFDTAKKSFEACNALSPSPDVNIWIQRCTAKSTIASEVLFSRLIRYENPPPLNPNPPTE
jgi:hypothetical protein